VIVLDSSVVVAILRSEAGFEQFVEVIDAADSTIMSHANFLEVGIVMIRRFGAASLTRLSRVRASFAVELRPTDEQQMELAIRAYAEFGKGTGHPAQLNYGDCFAYALAKSADQPLLYKGDDFARTDIRSAL
jgi:ribonuclease VapC